MGYFTLEKLIHSNLAVSKGWDNTPPASVKGDMLELINNVLDPLHDLYGGWIRVNSGYRCPRLNTAVGSSSGSQHLKGQAADLDTDSYENNYKLYKLIQQLPAWDQLIWEDHRTRKQKNEGVETTGLWIHVSYKKGRNRKQVFALPKGTPLPDGKNPVGGGGGRRGHGAAGGFDYNSNTAYGGKQNIAGGTQGTWDAETKGGLINVVQDPNLNQSPIFYYLNETAHSEQAFSQISQYIGITYPLVQINRVLLKPEQICSFELTSNDILPKLYLTFTDDNEIFKTVDKPTAENEIRVQILPPYDKHYQKINLSFSISKIVTHKKQVTLTGRYKCPHLDEDKCQSLGNISTYDLVNQVSNATGLGFASNLTSTSDNRYVYFNNKSPLDLLKKEVPMGGTENQILQCWVDYWNYLNLVDIYDRFNAYEKNKSVWARPSAATFLDQNPKFKLEPIETAAVITNNQNLKTSELYSNKYNVINKTGTNISHGTDRMYGEYDGSIGASGDTLVYDGDIHDEKHVVSKSNYIGESFSSHNGLLQVKKTKAFIQKITGQTIEVSLKCPFFGLKRGDRVNLLWYDINDLTLRMKSDIPNADLPPLEYNAEAMENKNYERPSVNKMISGQYLIYATKLKFNVNKPEQWEYILTLTRQQDKFYSYVDNESSESTTSSSDTNSNTSTTTNTSTTSK